jgi:hypothetical protein
MSAIGRGTAVADACGSRLVLPAIADQPRKQLIPPLVTRSRQAVHLLEPYQLIFMGWAADLKLTVIACKMIETAKLDGVEPRSWLTKLLAAFLVHH